MAVSAELRAFVLELFADLGHVTARAMMGGLAIYADGRIFALVGPGDRIYIKASGELAEALASAGSEQFIYSKAAGRLARMGYWTLPDVAVDDPSEACDWGRRSLAASDPGYS